MKFINQQEIINRITAAIKMTKTKGRHYNFLAISSAGMGKTTLAKLYFEILKIKPYESLGSTFNPVSLLFTDTPHIFIDEIHNLNSFDKLYPYMDNEKSTTFFCTTEFTKLPEAFTSRCIILRFQPYELNHIVDIVMEYSRYLGFEIQKDTAELIAKRCKGNPRIAKLMLTESEGLFKTFKYEFSIAGFEKLFTELGIYEHGLTKIDVAYLAFIKKLGTSSIKTISRGINIDESAIMESIEPWLIQNNYIKITNKGRIINPFIIELLENLQGGN